MDRVGLDKLRGLLRLAVARRFDHVEVPAAVALDVLWKTVATRSILTS